MGTSAGPIPKQDESNSQSVQATSTTHEPTIQEIRSWNVRKLLDWIKQNSPNALTPEYEKKFLEADIDGDSFLDNADNNAFFRQAGLTLGASQRLAKLARKTLSKKRDSEQAELTELADIASKRRRLENQKCLQLSPLRGSSAIYETKSVVDNNNLFFPSNAAFSNFFNEPSTIIVDKTHFIPLLEENPFEYMFLRPRRWGKSTFLNMLAVYYDVKTKDSFEELFGGLHIGKTPTKSRNSHLILLFDFSSITPIGSLDQIKQSIFSNVSRSLRRFLLKYQDILGDVLLEEYIIPNCVGESLSNVLDLIQRKGYTAFVGVDEYDAPANTCLTSALSNRECLSGSKETINLLGVLLKSEFFAVIKGFCGVSVAKYWLTGVLPAFRDGISPLTATRVISFSERYHSLCGLMQEDVNAIVERALPESKRASTLDSLKRWYNGYIFSPTSSSSEIPTLYNPQLVFVHLQNVISNQAPPSYVDEANAVHTATVLSVVGKTGSVTISDLIDMLYSKANVSILNELSFLELIQEQEMRPKAVTWSLLYYLGIVTYSKDSCCLVGKHILHVPNTTMVHLINRRIKEYLSGDPSFSAKMRNSYRDFMRSNTTPFVKLLEDFFRQRPTRSLADTNEPVLQITIELLWFGETQCLTEIHLIVDPTKRQGDGRNGFVDFVVSNSQRQHNDSNSILVMELKNVSLRYLWKARQENPKAEPTSQNDYGQLLSELEQATEKQLLDLKYSFFDNNSRGYVTRRVENILQDATAQLDCYISIISCGKGDSTRPGVHDSRLLCQKGGQDVLWGYVIICVAGMRVICRQTAKIVTDYSYEFTGTQYL